MSNDIAPILKKYEGQDTRRILENPYLERDIAFIGKAMEEGDETTRKDGRQFFLSLLGEIDVKINELKNDMKGHGETMDHIQKMSDACIAYMKQTTQ